MIRRLSDLVPQAGENLRGGRGRGHSQVFFQRGEFSTPLTAFNVLTLDPGASVGRHQHVGSEEVYWVLEGTGLAEDDDRGVELKVGDALLTGDGHWHSIQNPGPGPLRILTVLSEKSRP